MVTLLELVFYETWQKIAFITSPANATKNIIKRPSPERLEKQVSGNELSQFSTISIEKRFISCITNCIPEDSRLANKSNTKIKLNSPNNSCNATKNLYFLASPWEWPSHFFLCGPMPPKSVKICEFIGFYKFIY